MDEPPEVTDRQTGAGAGFGARLQPARRNRRSPRPAHRGRTAPPSSPGSETARFSQATRRRSRTSRARCRCCTATRSRSSATSTTPASRRRPVPFRRDGQTRSSSRRQRWPAAARRHVDRTRGNGTRVDHRHAVHRAAHREAKGALQPVQRERPPAGRVHRSRRCQPAGNGGPDHDSREGRDTVSPARWLVYALFTLPIALLGSAPGSSERPAGQGSARVRGVFISGLSAFDPDN